ncbi:hypothetical protein N3K66_000880 [Trichothecium roseum]|uniref:Uncharacterized protein n=1 Tax=Trichothecium roseum TaxID=47278 RepID=A0ACC0VD49_9HYPO|nr:hypothetical protein N3K66_000880 [Trichothecium roseum]
MVAQQVLDSPGVSELEQLAQEIASKTQEFTEALRKHGCALPSHDPQAPRNDSLPVAATGLQRNLMELTTELQTLVLGPRIACSQPDPGINIHAIYKFKLPTLVPADGSIRYSELAEKI